MCILLLTDLYFIIILNNIEIKDVDLFVIIISTLKHFQMKQKMVLIGARIIHNLFCGGEY